MGGRTGLNLPFILGKVRRKLPKSVEKLKNSAAEFSRSAAEFSKSAAKYSRSTAVSMRIGGHSLRVSGRNRGFPVRVCTEASPVSPGCQATFRFATAAAILADCRANRKVPSLRGVKRLSALPPPPLSSQTTGRKVIRIEKKFTDEGNLHSFTRMFLLLRELCLMKCRENQRCMCQIRLFCQTFP